MWCDLHVARNVLCTAISRAVVYKYASFSKTLGMSHKIHACTSLASVKFKSSCTISQGGLEVPCILRFEGEEKEIAKLKKFLKPK